MNSDHPTSDGSSDGNPALQQTLDRIAAALEKRNEQAQQQGNQKQGDDKEGDKQESEDGKKGGDEEKKKPGKFKRFVTSPLGIIVILALVAVLVLAGLWLWHYEKTHESTDDAYTTGHTHIVSPRVEGLVIERWVDDNQLVKQGDLLIKLDPRDYEVAWERADANLKQTQAQVLQTQGQLSQADAAILQARAQVTQARAQVDQAGANYEIAGVNYGRTSSLFGKDLRAVAKQDVDTTKSSLDANQAALNAAKANVEAAESNVKAAVATRDSRAGDLEAAKAAVDVARASVDNAKLQLSYCWVLAPVDGRVSKRTVEVGQQLAAGQAILSVTPDDVWVLANYKETQLEHVRVGQRVQVAVDMFKDHPFTGHVDSIQNGTGATYSLLPPDNATGNFTKIVQRVPVKIVFDRDDSKGSIKGFEELVVPGLSCEPNIELSSTDDHGEHVAKDQPAPPKGKSPAVISDDDAACLPHHLPAPLAADLARTRFSAGAAGRPPWLAAVTAALAAASCVHAGRAELPRSTQARGAAPGVLQGCRHHAQPLEGGRAEATPRRGAIPGGRYFLTPT